MRLLRPSCSRPIAAFVLALTAGTLYAQAPAEQSGQSSKTWVGRHQEVEEFLKTALIDKCEDIPVGVTSPIRCTLATAGPVKSVAWKKVHGRFKGFWDSYKADIAAYELDKLLGLDMVPVCVEMRVKGDLGGASTWVENTKVWRIDEPVRGPDPVAWDRQVIRMKMFDNLSGNTDRNAGNLLIDPAFNLILIDHSRGFTAGKNLPMKMTRIDAEFWEKINALTLEQLTAALGKWIDKGQVRDIITRRERMQKAIEQLVAEKGEAFVFLR